MGKRTLILAAIAAGALPTVAHARLGDPDATYGRGGVAPVKIPTIGFPAQGPTRSLAMRINPGGTIDVVAPTGDGSRTVMSQLHYDATLARSGQVRAPFGVSGISPYWSVRSGGGFVTLGAAVTALGTQATVVRTTATGALDTSFGKGGVVRLPVAHLQLNVSRIAAGPAGTVVVALLVNRSGVQVPFVRLVRLRANGSLDTSFGSGGIVNVALRDADAARVGGLAVMPDARVVVGLSGYDPPGGALGSVMRRRANGSLDTSFDSDGIAQAAPASAGTETMDMVAQPDGKVTVIAADFPAGLVPLMYRLGTNGRVDTTFGTSGSRTTLLASGWTFGNPGNLVRRADGRYVVAVYSAIAGNSVISLARTDANGKNGSTVELSGSDGLFPAAVAATSTKVVLAATNDVGRVALADVADTNATGAGVTFAIDNAGGITQRSMPYNSQVFADTGGGVLVVNQTGAETLQIAALTRTGAMNQTFGPLQARGGVYHAGLVQGGRVTGLRRLADGRIAVTTAGGPGGGALIMMRADGSLDPGFAGASGGVFSFGNASYDFGDVVRLPDGKLLVGYGYFTGATWQIGMMRMSGAGIPDTTFSGDGMVELPYPAGMSENTLPPGAVHVHAGVGGYVAVAGSSRTVVARVSTSGAPDPTLGSGTGVAAVGPAMRVNAATVDGLGRTIVVGSNTTEGVVIRLTPALGLDTSFSGDGVFGYAPPRGVSQVHGVAVLPDRSLVLRALDVPAGGGLPVTVYLAVSARGVQLARSEAFGVALGGIASPTADGRLVVGTSLPNADVGQPEVDMRRIKGIAPAAPLSTRRTVGGTFKVRVDARGLTATRVLIQARRSGTWRTIGAKVVLARVGYRSVSLSTSRKVTDSTFRAVVINASGRTNGRSFRG